MPYRHRSNEFKDQMIAAYQGGMSLKKMLEVHGIRSRSLQIWMRKRKIIPREPLSCRTRTLNEAAFDIRTESSEYWAGFLAADGCVTENGESWKVSLGLTESDRHHIQKFLDFLGSDAPIQTTPNYPYKPMSAASVFSKRLGEALIRLGVTPRKSKTMKIIGLEKSRHFWRGAIDGDGHIGQHQQGYPSLALHGAKDLMEQFSRYVGGSPVEPQKSIFRVRLSGRKAMVVMSDLYGCCNVSLDRKHDEVFRIMTESLSRRKWCGWSLNPEGYSCIFHKSQTGDACEL